MDEQLGDEANQLGLALKAITEQGMGLSIIRRLWICVRKRTQIDATGLAPRHHCCENRLTPPVIGTELASDKLSPPLEPGLHPETTAFLQGDRL